VKLRFDEDDPATGSTTTAIERAIELATQTGGSTAWGGDGRGLV
jgi:hypothetical protein